MYKQRRYGERSTFGLRSFSKKFPRQRGTGGPPCSSGSEHFSGDSACVTGLNDALPSPPFLANVACIGACCSDNQWIPLALFAPAASTCTQHVTRMIAQPKIRSVE